MTTSLTDFDPADGGKVEQPADGGPAEDITLDDLGEDKELNTPPEDAPEDGQENELEADQPKEAESEKDKSPAEEPKKEATQEATAAVKADAEKTTEEILKHLGMDSTLKIKGKEYKLSEFEKDDLLAYIQKGVRMTQIGQDLSKREAALVERERVAEANARQATEILARVQSAAPAQGKVETEPPDDLRPSEYDTEDVKAVKQAALAVWKQNQDQAQRLNAIEGGLQSQQTEAENRKFMDELLQHKADYPLASVEEVIAVHAHRPDIPLSDLVRRSHSIYSSAEHIEEVFKNAPEVRKHFEEKAVAAYLARQRGARVVSEKPSSQGSRPASAAKTAIRSMDDAGLAARRMLAKLALESESDND